MEKDFLIIAGPCAVESKEQIVRIAKKLKKIGVNVLRGGAFKPRTNPNSFQGLQDEGIEYLLEAKKVTGLPIITELLTIEQVKKSKTPILYIHGNQDDFVPYYMMEELYNATSSEKEMLIIKGAEHAKASEVDPESYWTTVNNFINKYMN